MLLQRRAGLLCSRGGAQACYAPVLSVFADYESPHSGTAQQQHITQRFIARRPRRPRFHHPLCTFKKVKIPSKVQVNRRGTVIGPTNHLSPEEATGACNWVAHSGASVQLLARGNAGHSIFPSLFVCARFDRVAPPPGLYSLSPPLTLKFSARTLARAERKKRWIQRVHKRRYASESARSNCTCLCAEHAIIYAAKT